MTSCSREEEYKKMARGGGGPGGAAGSSAGGTQDEDAKEVLDKIGQQVYEQVKGEAEKYKGELEGKLTSATNRSSELSSSLDPCSSDYTKHFDARGDPCGKDRTGKEHRFSKERVDEYDNKKMKCSNGDACAPYRRLSLCNKNMVKMDTNNDSKAKHDLLLDVCHAAKYEGQSITRDYQKYRATYVDSPFELCTVLARSFADIGDIIRGRDLYLGNRKKKPNGKETERDKLDKNLKTIFGKIYEGLTTTKNGAQTYYEDNDTDKNYFKLREDWWTANRSTIWEAITCDDDKELASASYFRETCAGGTSPTPNKCRCSDKANADPPTYFDYVPQYLRWFEEWAEDFCTKRKHKLENAITNCRGHYYGKPRYCSRNGCDCEQTIYKKGYFVIDKGCINCLYACNPYVEWIDKKKEEFEKQKEKYPIEIEKYENGASGSSRAKRAASTKVYDGYESKFYNILKNSSYSDVNNFLEKLSNEEICTKNNDIKEGGKINFAEKHDNNNNNEEKGTFYRSKYCQPCPDCGVQRNGDEWIQKNNGQCEGGKRYEIPKGTPYNDINVLSFGDKREDRETKLNKFCETKNGNTTNGTGGGGSVGGGTGAGGSSGGGSSGGGSSGGGSSGGGSSGGGSNSEMKELIEKWKCYKEDDIKKLVEYNLEYYKEVNGSGGICILENKKKTSDNDPQEFQKTFNNFFYYWVAHMLKDSIYWKKKLQRCLQNGNRIKCENKKCNSDCVCFQKWIGKKEKEWTNIKEHFKTQDFGKQGENVGSDMLGEAFRSPDVVLEGVLRLEFENKNTEQDKKNNVSAEEAKEIQHLRKMLEEEENEENQDEDAGAAPVTGKRTLMDKLLNHEKGEANKCKQKQEKCERQKQQRQKQANENLGRSLNPADPKKEDSEGAGDDEDDADENEEDDDEDGKEENVEDEESEENTEEDGKVKETTETTPQETQPAAPAGPDACNIVKTVFEDTTALKQACPTKYVNGREKFPNWKCVTSGDKAATRGSDASGSICVPPRRRRLYVTPLTKWANTVATQASETTQGTTQAGTPSPSPSDGLLAAFVESAAIETFFLWHKYKMDKEREEKEKNTADGELFANTSHVGEELQEKLDGGNIPEDFKRQMFYTLGDYRDILFSGDKDKKNGYNDIFSGDKEIAQREKEIKDTIQTFFQNGDSQTPRGNQSPSDDKTPESWWQKNGEHIWKGMICALTYKENSSGGDAKTPEQDPKVKKAFFGDNNNKNPANPGPQNGTYQSTYDYTTVTFKGGLNGDTKLEEFVKRPPYFRWLEEWTEDFCRKKKIKIEKIKNECRSDREGKRYCSSDGHDCEKEQITSNEIFVDLHCDRCGKECINYKKWIFNKRNEFDKQKNKCQEEIQKSRTSSNKEPNEQFHNYLKQQYTSVEKFLASLNHCKHCESNSDQDNKIDFEDIPQTFSPSTYCKACPVYGLNCKKNSGCTPIIKTNENKTEGTPSDIHILLNDVATKDIYEKLKDCSEQYSFFKGLREQKWECQKKNGIDQCNIKNAIQHIDIDQDISFNELFQRWLRYFLQDYNKFKDKIHPCINEKKGKEDTCIKECNNKCECMKKWLNKKEDEWEKIKKYYDKQKKENDYGIPYWVKAFFEREPFDTDYKKAQKVVDNPCDREKLWGCTGDNLDGNKKNCKDDFITNLITKFTEKIRQCQSKHNGTDCSDTPQTQTLDDETFDDDIETEDVKAPNICPKETVDQKTKVEDEKCDKTPPVVPEKKEQEPAEKKNTEDQTPPAPLAPSDESILQTTIPFGVALALGSIAFLFLKVIYICVGYMYIYVFSVYVCLSVWIYICGCICVFGYIYIYVYVFSVYVCVLYIFYIYICIYIKKEKNEKKEKKKNEI